jgi:hypothetical protein
MPAIFSAVLSWIFREAVIKFAVFSAMMVLVRFLVPMAIGWISPFLGLDSLYSAFSVFPPFAQYFLVLFGFNYGFPLLISAYVARFLIRRLPVIG